MFNGLFGSVIDGRLARLAFLGYLILIAFLVIGIGIGIAVTIGIAEQVIGGDLQAAQAQLQQQFGIVAIVGIGVVFLLLAFAGLNLQAKRIRDIGLPGWWTVLGLAIAGGALSYAVSEQAASGLHSLVMLVLLLVPGKTGRGAEASSD